MNVVYIAVFIVITAVSSLFAWIGPDEIRKSRMRNIEPAVDDVPIQRAIIFFREYERGKQELRT